MSATAPVSIIMATFNGVRYIGEQIASLASQTSRPAEVIIIDDASSDDTVDVARKCLMESGIDFRILVNDARLGPWETFLRGLHGTSQDYVAFCDQDDVWRSDKLALCMEELNKPDVSLVIHNAMLTDAGLRPMRVHDQQISSDCTLEPLALDPYVGPSAGWGNCMVFRRDVAMIFPASDRPEQPGEDRPLSHDTWVYVLSAALGRVRQLEAELILYRQHQSNVTSSLKPMSVTISDRFRDPTPVYLRRARFCRQCAVVFRGITVGEGIAQTLVGNAQEAAIRYDQRAHFWESRAGIYGGQNLAIRFDSLRIVAQSARLSAELGGYWRLSSRIKDTLNALTGLHRRRLTHSSEEPRL